MLASSPPLSLLLLEHLGREAELGAPSELEGLLSRLVQQAAAAWPTVQVDTGLFLRYLADRLSSGEDLSRGLESLNVAGLYLACGCALGDSAAIAAIDTAFFGDCDDALRRMATGPGFADDVKQQVRTKLFVAEPGAPPRITEYRGRGELRAFIRILLTRQAISQRRKRREVHLDTGRQSTAAEVWAAADPEILHLRNKYGSEFQSAFREAVVALTSEDRNLLRYHYLDGLNIDHIGAIYGIHRVSAARRLTKVRQKLVLDTRRLLAARLRLHSEELESVLRLLESEVDISLRAALDEASAGA
jgi:RNA polymerase sigma-70 factor (ECF subfamily)